MGQMIGSDEFNQIEQFVVDATCSTHRVLTELLDSLLSRGLLTGDEAILLQNSLTDGFASEEVIRIPSYAHRIAGLEGTLSQFLVKDSPIDFRAFKNGRA